MAKIVNGDNFGSDHPYERFVENLPTMRWEQAEQICDVINKVACSGYGEVGGPRYFRVVDDDYVLNDGGPA